MKPQPKVTYMYMGMHFRFDWRGLICRIVLCCYRMGRRKYSLTDIGMAEGKCIV